MGLKPAMKNQTLPVDFGMNFLMSAFQKILKSSLSSSQVRLQAIYRYYFYPRIVFN